MFKRTTLFSFESVNTEDKVWKLAVDIPVHGEELLSLGWKEANVGRVQLKGQFAKRILKSAKNHPQSKKYSPLIKSFLKGWSQFIYINDTLKKNPDLKVCENQSCKLGRNTWTWQMSNNHLLVDYRISNNQQMRFDFSNFSGDTPHRVTIAPTGQTLENTPFQLDLFVKACE